MDDPLIVGGGHPAGDFPEQDRRGSRAHTPILLESIGECAARQKLQGEIRPTAGLPELVDLNDMGVFDGSDGLGFGQEPEVGTVTGAILFQD
jgi:hypothetical protein